jgi:hypothetical protein
MTCPALIPTHADCPSCPGEIVVGRTQPVIDHHEPTGDGEMVAVVVQLPYHVALPCAVFDPTGLIAVDCEHGIKERPDGKPFPPRGPQGSWLRSKYARSFGNQGVRCVIDHREPRPADLTTPLV